MLVYFQKLREAAKEFASLTTQFLAVLARCGIKKGGLFNCFSECFWVIASSGNACQS